MNRNIVFRILMMTAVLFILIGMDMEVRVNAQDSGQEAESLTMTFHDATLKSYETREQVAFSDDHSVYILQVSGNETRCTLTEGYAIKEFDRELVPDKEGYYHIDTSGMAAILRITDQSGKSAGNFYFVLQDSEGSIPLEGQTDETKAQAGLMLTGWLWRTEKEKKTMNNNRYWDTFMSAATDLDMRGATAFDVTRHTFNYPSDWAGCAIELIMTGRNPYDHNGVNYVESMKKRSFNGNYGPYANNTWALIVLRMCGEEIPDNLVYNVKNMAKDKRGGDIRPWALAALSDWDDPRISQEEIVAMSLEMKETLQSDGLWGNAYTNGCYLTGIAASGVNIDYFSTDKGSILDLFAEKYMTKDYKFIYGGEADSYVKDAIIGLGDMIHERSIWISYALTPEKLASLIDQAKAIQAAPGIETSDDDRAALAEAIEIAENVSGQDYGYGPAYYDLYEVLARIDDTYNLHIRFLNKEQEQQIDKINQFLDAFSSKKVSYTDASRIQEGWADFQALLTDSNQELAGYVDRADRFDVIFGKLIKAIDDRIASLDELTGQGSNFDQDSRALFEELKNIIESLDEDQAGKLQNRDVYDALAKAYEADVQPEEDTKEESGTTETSETQSKKVAVGTRVTVKGGVYKITANSSKKRTASLVGTKKKTIRKLTIPATISAGGKKYKVTSIGAKALKSRKNLTSVTVGKNVVKIGTRAFAGCGKLKKITIRSTRLKKVGSGALKGINKKAVIKVPKKKRKGYKKLFKNKGQKKTVKVS